MGIRGGNTVFFFQPITVRSFLDAPIFLRTRSMFFFGTLASFLIIPSFLGYNIFKNAFYVVFFGTMASFLIIPFVSVKERSFPENGAQPFLRHLVAKIRIRKLEVKFVILLSS